MVKVDFLGLCSITFCGPLDAALSHEFRLSLYDGMPCVVIRIGFVVRAIVGDTLGDEVWIVTTGESTFGVSPVMLRLAQPCTGSAIGPFSLFTALPGSVRRIHRNLEIPQMVCLRGFHSALYIEILVIFLVSEAR